MPHSMATKGTIKQQIIKNVLTCLSADNFLPWKNSLVLKAPADIPIEVCTSRSDRIPVADCRVDAGFKAALRRSDKLREIAAAIVAITAQGLIASKNPASPASAAAALSRTRPEANPMRV